jgi:hypothetical protein
MQYFPDPHLCWWTYADSLSLLLWIVPQWTWECSYLFCILTLLLFYLYWGVGWLDHMVTLFFIFWGTPHSVFHQGYYLLLAHQHPQPHWYLFIYLFFFLQSHSNLDKLVSHCRFFGEWALRLELRAYWTTPPALFLWRVFRDRGSWNICPGWLQTAILLISVSWVARITGLSHWCPVLL